MVRTGLLEDGLLNARTPILDFHRGMCDFCGRCAAVCPTSTIGTMDPAVNRIGVAVVDEERCIAWSGGSACLVCVDVCPTGAITEDASGRPVVNAALCNGCGACEYACPSNRYRAFTGGRTRGINVQGVAADTPPLDGPAVAAAWEAFFAANGAQAIAAAGEEA